MYRVGENEHGWHVYDALGGIVCTSRKEENARRAAEGLDLLDRFNAFDPTAKDGMIQFINRVLPVEPTQEGAMT